ncbi:aspartic-type endopeptidase [Malassezia pachydermatis]|uniref:Putative aspartyl protease n=1 Tax=Malassezia pachydermatis TaxID=77020 RepID=A0A0M8MR50_9BASI|nr:putative aspartyl protease [Malassezia pachydermatis]KOS15137.1 putative aspartyl protease [Malassezia pachydermatis]
MLLHLKFVAGLIAAATVASATERQGVSIEMSRRTDEQMKQIRVQRVPQHISAVNRKYTAAMKNYQRNTGKSHPMGSDSKAKRSSGDVGLIDINEQLEWSGKVQFGSPAQSIYFDFDTGSSDTLVDPGSYDPSASYSSMRTSGKFSAAYGDGTSASGTIYQDDVSIGGIKAKSVSIGLSNTKFTKDYEKPNQGICGLALPSIQAFPSDYHPLFTALREQHQVDQGVFQFTLKSGSGSSLHLGGIDKTKIKGDIAWANYDQSLGFYVVPGKLNGQNIQAIIDSGTTLIIGPTKQVKSILEAIPDVKTTTSQGSLMGTFPCDQTPNVTFTFAGKDFKLGRDQLVYGSSNGRCNLPLVGQDSTPFRGNSWIVGDAFFQTASVIFDQDKNRLGFAEQA